MAIAAGIKKILDSHHVYYRLFSHQRTKTLESAVSLMGIDERQVIKGVLLVDNISILLAVIPLNKRIDFVKLKKKTGRDFTLLPAFKGNRIFKDCEAGTCPVFGTPYGLDMILEKSIESYDMLFMEAGSHNTLINLSTNDFLYLNSNAIKLHFTRDKQTYGTDTPFVPALQTFSTSREDWFNLEVCQFPNMPPVAQSILKFAQDPGHSLQELTEVISQNEQLHEQILRYVQLPQLTKSLGIKAEKGDLFSKILDFDTVSHVALGVAAGHGFDTKELKIDLQQYWRHALYAALLSQLLAAEVKPALRLEPCVCYLGGLLHNIGYLLFAKLYPPEFQLLDKWSKLNPEIPIYLLEKRLLGLGRAFHIIRGGHAQLGAWLLHYWEMPLSIQIMAKAHHQKDYSGDFEGYVKLIQLTNKILKKYQIGDEKAGGPEPELLEYLGLNEARVYDITHALFEETQQLDSMAESFAYKD